MKFPAAILLMCLTALGAERLTLEDARRRAMQHNRLLRLARLKVEENEHKRAAARSDYFPKVLTDANYFYFNKPLGTTLEFGGLGILPPPLPSVPIPIDVVKRNLFFGGVTVGQPLTQLFKVRAGERAAEGERDVAKAQADKAAHEVSFGVEQLYYGLLITEKQKAAAQLKVTAAEELLRDAQNAVDSGTALAVATLGRRAQLLEAKQNVLALETQAADYAEALNNLMGAAVHSRWELEEPERPAMKLSSAEEAAALALRTNPEVREAEVSVARARAGVRAAQADYIPDVTAFGTYYYQSGIPTMPGDFGAVGGRMSYTLFEFGKRRAQVRERRILLEQAEENLRRIKEKLISDVRKSFRAVDRSSQMVNVAREAAQLRAESERLSRDQFELGLATKSALLEAQAARASAEADLLRAEAGFRLALADLHRTLGQ